MERSDSASIKILSDAIIPVAKLTRYLLIKRTRNDKSKFLAQAGFTLNNYADLENALRKLILDAEAVEDRTDEYGTFYQASGSLEGINGICLNVVTVWLHRKIDQRFQFVTLVPDK
ncbi:MAG: DUF6883 domain-containing protein [Cyanobacteria bacterium J06581_3]